MRPLQVRSRSLLAASIALLAVAVVLGIQAQNPSPAEALASQSPGDYAALDATLRAATSEHAAWLEAAGLPLANYTALALDEDGVLVFVTSRSPLPLGEPVHLDAILVGVHDAEPKLVLLRVPPNLGA